MRKFNEVFEVAEPIEVEEIIGGKFDGDYRVVAACPGCGGEVEHLVTPFEYWAGHRRPDCSTWECREGPGYDVVRPMQGLFGEIGSGFKWWDVDLDGPTPNLGFGTA